MTTLTGLLLLDKASLLHFDYHWVWGLRFNKLPQANNLAVELDELIANPLLFKSLQTNQQKIDQRHPVVRFLFRLFNIENYAINAYKLAAYESHMVFLSMENNMPMEPISSGQRKTLSLLLQGALEKMLNLLFKNNFTLQFFPESDETALSIGTPQKPAELVDESNRAQQIIVTQAIQGYLITLGINKQNDELLTWKEIKVAYRKMALQTHPDKASGSNQAFDNLKKAIDALELVIFGKMESSSEAFTQWRNYFQDALDELDATLDRVNEGIAEVKAGIAEVNGGIAELKSDIADLNAGIEDLNAKIIKRNEKIMRILESLPHHMDPILPTTLQTDFGLFPKRSQTNPLLKSPLAAMSEVDSQHHPISEQAGLSPLLAHGLFAAPSNDIDSASAAAIPDYNKRPDDSEKTVLH